MKIYALPFFALLSYSPAFSIPVPNQNGDYTTAISVLDNTENVWQMWTTRDLNGLAYSNDPDFREITSWFTGPALGKQRTVKCHDQVPNGEVLFDILSKTQMKTLTGAFTTDQSGKSFMEVSIKDAAGITKNCLVRATDEFIAPLAPVGYIGEPANPNPLPPANVTPLRPIVGQPGSNPITPPLVAPPPRNTPAPLDVITQQQVKAPTETIIMVDANHQPKLPPKNSIPD